MVLAPSVACIYANTAKGQIPELEWVDQPTSVNDVSLQDIHAITSTEIVIYGTMFDSVTFDSAQVEVTLESSYTRSPFIYQLDNTGQFEWAKFVDVYLPSSFESTIDNQGFRYMAGLVNLAKEWDIDPSENELLISLYSDALILKFSQTGDFIWARIIGDGTFFHQEPFGLEVDGFGNVYTCGFFSGTADFDPGPDTLFLDPANGSSFIHKMDSEGNFLWAKQVATAYPESRAQDLALDDEANIYVTGRFRDTVDFDPGPDTSMLSSAGDWDAFILKLNTDGTYQWANRFGGPDLDWGLHIEARSDGTIIAAGTFNGMAFLSPSSDTVELQSVSGGDIYLLKIDADGDVLQFGSIGGSQSDYITEMSLDPFGNLYFSSAHTGTADLDPGPGVTLRTGKQLTKLDPDLNLIWTVPMTLASGIAVDSAQNVHVCGSFTGSVDLNPSPTEDSIFVSNGNSAVFVLKLNQDSLLTSSVRQTETISGLEVSVYPNPSTKKFNVDVPEMTGSINYSVSDLTGRLIESGVSQSSRFQIELVAKPGVYLLTLYSDDDWAVVRLVRE